MSELNFGKSYNGKSALKLHALFFPVIGAPLAADLIRRAGRQCWNAGARK